MLTTGPGFLAGPLLAPAYLPTRRLASQSARPSEEEGGQRQEEEDVSQSPPLVRRRRRPAASEQAGSGRPSPSFVRVGKEEEGDLDHTYIGGGQAGVQDPRVIQCRLDINVCLIGSA